MYLDYILFAMGGVLILLGIILMIRLFCTRKKIQDYRRVLNAETQRIDVVSTLQSTAQLGVQNQSKPVAPDLTEKLAPDYTETDILEIEQSTIDMGLQPTASGAEAQAMQDNAVSIEDGLDLSPLSEKYELLREIHRGGMSRIFLARHKKLGNEWIVKFVDGRQAELANEAEVLKKLNHISLPQIIDIFQSKQGTFLVERYIEGYPLDQVLTLKESIKESLICDWGLQLAQVLHYLHNLEVPIIHCDLKPSNIMVTHDNRLVLIDFGISKRQGITEKELGLTYNYAAPEQFRGRAGEVAQRRFGQLPPDAASWPIDARTDLYSVGVILYELIVGTLPSPSGIKQLHSYVTPKLAEVICRCLEVEPSKRFQAAGELAEALERSKGYHLTMARSLVMRRVAAVCCGFLLAGGLVTSASAAYINQQENLSVVSMDPGQAVVTAQQSVQLLIQKVTPNGETITLEPDKINWSYSDENIARVDGDRLVGINVGETTLRGQYRNKIIELNVVVTEPVGETTAVALRYEQDAHVSVYAGNGEREQVDGALAQCSFVSPESIAANGGRLYVSDSGVIRIIEDGKAASMPLEPDFLTADLVRGWDGDIYLLTGPWEADDGSYYGFIRISNTGAEFLYYTEAAWSAVTDFAFSSDGTLWFIQQNLGTGMTTLNTLDVDSLESGWVMDLPDSAQGMAFDGADNLYLTVPEQGMILRVGKGETSWSYFAGIEGERDFIDGAIPSFYRPTSLAVDGDTLYVLDFDTVRMIAIEGEGARFTETLAGVPTEDTNPVVVLGDGKQAVLPASELATLALDSEGHLLVSDPKNSVIYEIVIPR